MARGWDERALPDGRAQADLDNLKLAEVAGAAGALLAEFQLEAVLLTGQCIDSGAANREQVTPRGVQLWAGRGQRQHLRDTVVMSNLGYFQLQASPGAWTLHLAPGAPPHPPPPSPRTPPRLRPSLRTCAVMWRPAGGSFETLAVITLLSSGCCICCVGTRSKAAGCLPGGLSGAACLALSAGWRPA